MRKYKHVEKKVVVYDSEEIEYTQCDICGVQVPYDGGLWKQGYDTSTEVVVKKTVIIDDNTFIYWYDICPACFDGVFAEMMKDKFGAKANVY